LDIALVCSGGRRVLLQLNIIFNIILQFLYTLGIFLYVAIIRIASFFNKKARQWVLGRKGVFTSLEKWRKENATNDVIWFHCASLGEFEQGRPVLEAIRKTNSNTKIILTFFSPSGYEVRKNYSDADWIGYLPADTPSNAKKFIGVLQPKAMLVVKYEYWANYFFEAKKNAIPLFMVSAILRPEQRFFGVLGSFWKKVLGCVTHFYVQTEKTRELLASIGFGNVSLAGDTRFDRVISIAQDAKAIAELERYCKDHLVIIGGSTWPSEERIMAACAGDVNESNNPLLWIIAPHEVNADHIRSIQSQFTQSVLWSELKAGSTSDSKVLIVDTIGLLSSAYRYAHIAIIGGAFGKGLHNILEAATWGMPVVFGPNYEKFEEARKLIEAGGARSFATEDDVISYIKHLIASADERELSGQKSKTFVLSQGGATEMIIKDLATRGIV
jgi:3-deoxy-D-manno-octulosonic-acid transferase